MYVSDGTDCVGIWATFITLQGGVAVSSQLPSFMLHSSVARLFVSRYIAIQRTMLRYVSQYIVVVLAKIK